MESIYHLRFQTLNLSARQAGISPRPKLLQLVLEGGQVDLACHVNGALGLQVQGKCCSKCRKQVRAKK